VSASAGERREGKGKWTAGMIWIGRERWAGGGKEGSWASGRKGRGERLRVFFFLTISNFKHFKLFTKFSKHFKNF
jgi:hypothetical protein